MQREATAMTVRQNLGELLSEVQYRRDSIVITKAGKPVAAIVDMNSYETLRKFESNAFDRLWAEIAEGFKDLSEQEVEAMVGEALQEARAEVQQQRRASEKPAA